MRNRVHKQEKRRYILQVRASVALTLFTVSVVLSLSQAGASTGEIMTSLSKPSGTGPGANHVASGGNGVHLANVSYASADQHGNYNPEVASTSRVQTTATSTQFTYNLDQQLTDIVQPGGVTVTFGYDGAGRLSTITHPLGSAAIAYAPATDNIAQLGSSDGVTITYGYDGPLITDTSWSGVISGTVHRIFNSDFNISSETVNGAGSATYVYDQDSLLTQAGALVATRNTQNGLLTGTTLGGVTDTLGYNQFGEVTAYTAAYNGSNLLVHANTRDNEGKITQRVETVSGITHTFVYTYDLAQRLTDVAQDGLILSHYSYSPNGNRTGYSGRSGTITTTYDMQDRLLQYGNLSFAYSPNGELQRKTNTGANLTTTYTYDAVSDLRAVTLPDGTQLSYVIDGNNRRVGKKINGVLAQGFLYGDGLAPVAELDGSGNIVSRFVYGTGGHAPSYMVRGGQTYFIVSDQLGSPRLMVSVANGQIAQRMDYDEFGNVLTDTNPGFQPFGFAGGIYDRDTGLVRFGARDYDPFTGRWTSKDPLLFEGGSTNLYVYTGNDPVNRMDPSGLFDVLDFVAVTEGPLPLLLFDAIPDYIVGSHREQRRDDERDKALEEHERTQQFIDEFDDKQFGPYHSREQAALFKQLLRSQLPDYLQAEEDYVCGAGYSDESATHDEVGEAWGNPRLNDELQSGQTQIFITIHVDPRLSFLRHR